MRSEEKERSNRPTMQFMMLIIQICQYVREVSKDLVEVKKQATLSLIHDVIHT